MKKSVHHVVKEAVDYAKAEHGTHVSGFVNAILRRFLRDEVKSNSSQDAIFQSFPQWLIKRWSNRFGHDQATRLLMVLNEAPEFTIRVNEQRIGKEDAIVELEHLGLTVRPGTFLSSALHIDRLSPLVHSDLLCKRIVYIQDEASQLAIHALRPEHGGLVLDACSGLGTKSSHILDLVDGVRLIAMDNSPIRLQHIDRRSNALQGDALHAPFKDETFNSILLDAPCSSLGIIRKHPEIKWRRKEKEIARFGAQQYEMLKSLWSRLKIGGHLVYCVCSFEPEETLGVIERFKNEGKFALENPLPFLFNKEYFVSLPHKTGMDGFFIARLKKL